MNDLIRPALYQSEMAVIPTQLNHRLNLKYGIWSGDLLRRAIFKKNRVLALADNDVLAITGQGRMGL